MSEPTISEAVERFRNAYERCSARLDGIGRVFTETLITSLCYGVSV